MEYSVSSPVTIANPTMSQFNLNPYAAAFIPNVYFKSCDFSPRNICKGYHALNDTLQAPSSSNSFHEISTIADDNNVYLENSDEGLEILSKIRTKNLNKVVIGLLNVNSLNAKIDSIRSTVIDKINIMVLVETKLDDTYPTSQFFMEGYCRPFRRDRNRYGGAIFIHVREDIPCKILPGHNLPEDISYFQSNGCALETFTS